MKRLISIFIVVCCLMVVTAYADTSEGIGVTSGACGDNLTWTLNGEGVLTISGTGAMSNFTSPSGTPWEARKSLIKTVVINDAVTSVGNYAFYECSNVCSVSLPDSMTHIGSYAFGECRSLESIGLPDSITSIGSWAFSVCTNLSSVHIPQKLTSISEFCFSNCWSLTDIELPEGITMICQGAFCYNTSLKTLSIPVSLERVSQNAFLECRNLSEIFYAGTFNQIEYISIGSGNTALTAALWHCTDKDSFAIGEISGTCGNNLTWTLSSEGVLTISGTGAMSNFNASSGTPWETRKSLIKTVVINDAVTSVGNYAFYECSNVCSVSLPDSMTHIGSYAFGECRSLESIGLPDSITSIGSWAFSVCTNLSSVHIPKKLTSISEFCFSNCWSLTDIELPEGISMICQGAFCYNKSLKTLSIPASLERVSQNAFLDCRNLSEIFYDGSKEQTELIQIGTGNTFFSASTWQYLVATPHTQLTFTLPRTLTTICEEAFSNVSAQKIVVPETVRTIKVKAFANNQSLQILYFEGAPYSIADDILSGCSNVVVDVVSGSSAEAWALANGYRVQYH